MTAARLTVPTAEHPITIEVGSLTPRLARVYLQNQAPNRRPKQVKILKFVRDIQAGRWRFTGEAIKFDTHGQMIDGQNRCEAVIRADRPITVLVIHGLDRETQRVMDSGTPRSVRDALKFAGYEKTKDLSAAISTHSAWTNGEFKHCMSTLGFSARPTNEEAIEYLDAYPELIEAAAEATNLYGRGVRLPIGALATAILETRSIDPEASFDFFNRAAELRTNGIGDPVSTLLKRVTAMRDGARAILPSTALYMLFRSWNAFRDQEELKRLPLGAPARDGRPATWAVIPEPK